MRRLVTVLAVLAAGCGGAERQDAEEPSGEFRVELVEASLPERQRIAERVQLKLTVRNADAERLRNVAVTVETQPEDGDAAVAFGLNQRGAGLASAARPVWIVDAGPEGGDTASVNTWSAGALAPGQAKALTWDLVPSRAGTYVLRYRVSPGLTGRARPAAGRTRGRVRVTIEDDPVPARVGEDGEVIRGS